ncbi:MAG TPA: peptidoglycan-associated lipoprotein Pal [Burkholderiales bacterium]|jgi:peptidoglycan-associated lipoprotein|nr:peptidoglycan-associated lipoprotein Pal [Burkholderiales bacterium]
MRALTIATLAAGGVLLAACATSPETQPAAPVEGTPGGAAKPGAAVESKPVSPVEAGKAGGLSPFAALKDPASPLSKRSVYFDYDKFDVKEEYRPLVEAHAKFLRDNPTAKMLIQGNADERGSREYNVGLGQRRSDSLKKMLSLLGVKDSQMESVSLGEEKPVCNEHDEECWAKNRRDDMLYNGEY